MLMENTARKIFLSNLMELLYGLNIGEVKLVYKFGLKV